jgi:hypothetical protein
MYHSHVPSAKVGIMCVEKAFTASVMNPQLEDAKDSMEQSLIPSRLTTHETTQPIFFLAFVRQIRLNTTAKIDIHLPLRYISYLSSTVLLSILPSLYTLCIV